MLLTQRRSSLAAVLLGSVVALAGCGGSSGGSSDSGGDMSTATRGSVAMFMTDAPADVSLFSAVNIDVSRVALVPAGGGDPVVVREGEPVQVNLMDLTHEAIPLSYREGVPVGSYCEIRLGVESIELALAAGGSVYPEVPAGGSLSLVVSDCFDVVADGVVHVQLDLDMAKSIYQEEGEYLVRPVFFVDVIEDGANSRLVRLEGVIADLDPVAGRVLLCESVPVNRYDRDASYLGCAWAQTDAATGFFDNISHSGQPRMLSELFLDDKLAKHATVVGVVDDFGHGVLEIDIPAGQLPPPGECKLWYPERPAGQQPPPKDCEVLSNEAPTDTVVIDHDGNIILDLRGLMAINAVAVELGEFVQVDGSVAGSVENDEFTLDIRPGEPVQSDLPLPVVLQRLEGGNGTRLVSKTGETRTEADLETFEAVSVDGVVAVSGDGTYLRSALVVLDDNLAVLDRLSGTVLSVSDTGATVAAASAADNPCADVAGDVMVEVAGDARIVTVTLAETESTTTMGGTLQSDQVVDMYGTCNAETVFEASHVVIVDDQRTL